MSKRFTPVVIFFILFLLSVCMPRPGNATHVAGSELIYEWRSDSTYRFFFKFYDDCGGNYPALQEFDLCYYNPCNGFSGRVKIGKMTLLPGNIPNGTPIGTGCPGVLTTCTGMAAIPGFREWWYTVDLQLPSRCDNWIFSVSVNARNPSSNLVDAQNYNMYIEATLNNMDPAGFGGGTHARFSSPFFSLKPVLYICVNTPTSYSGGPVDPDGDVLTYEFITPRYIGSGSIGAHCQPLFTPAPHVFVTPFDLQNPFAANNTFVFDPVTSLMTFTPSVTGKNTVTVRVNKFRNGVRLGSVMRDVQFQVLPCDMPPILVDVIPTTVTGAQYINGRVEACAGVPFSFCYKAVAGLPNSVLVVEDNHITALPGSSVVYNNMYTDSVLACVSWSGADTGLRLLTIVARDSACRAPGVIVPQVFVIPVYVRPAMESYTEQGICLGDTLVLHAPFPGSSNLWSTGSTDSFITISSPGKYWVHIIRGVCAWSDTIEVFQRGVRPVVDIGPDTVACGPVVLRSSTSYVSPVWRWSTGAATPSITVTQTGQYWLEVTENGCKGSDTVSVTVEDMTVDLGRDFALCDRDTPVTLKASFPAGTQYRWSNGVSDSQIVVTRSGKYWLEVTRNDCPGSDTIEVTFVPTPFVYIGPDSTICEQTPARIGTVIPGATYLWSTGETMPYILVSSTNRYVLEINLEGCIVHDTIEITAMPSPEPDLGTDRDICPGETVLLDGSHDPGSRYLWNTGDTTAGIAVTSGGVYGLTVTSVYGCTGSDSIILRDYPKPTVSLGRDTTVCEETPLLLAPLGQRDADSLVWSDGSVGSKLMVRYGGEYIVTAINKCGTDSDTIRVEQIFCDITVPNVFTPDGDGINDVFHVLGNVGRVEGFRFSIFNRWGQLMFHTKDPYAGWDGMHQGRPSLLGTYVYLLEYSIAGKPYMQKGNFHLIR